MSLIHAPYQFFLNSFKLTFLHITPYQFDSTWWIRSKRIMHAVLINYTGLPPLAFIHQLKMEQAQKRLLSGTERVTEIAYRLGFKDANYLSRLFKRKTGYTPNDYRQMLRNWMSD